MAPFSNFSQPRMNANCETGRSYFFIYFHLGIIPSLKMPTLTFPFGKVYLLAFEFVV